MGFPTEKKRFPQRAHCIEFLTILWKKHQGHCACGAWLWALEPQKWQNCSMARAGKALLLESWAVWGSVSFSFPLFEPMPLLLPPSRTSCGFCDFFQEMRGLQSQSGGDVSVEVNATPGINLMEKLNAMRCEYERLIENNRKEVESWYETKVKHRRALVIKSFTKYWTYLQQVKGNLSHFI